MHQPIVFVGGVHGSGKSTLSRYLAGELPAVHKTAGELIREAATANLVVTVGAQGKAVPDVDANQEVLLRGLLAFQSRTGADTRPLLLDGHFALMNPDGEVVEVSPEVFGVIAPVAVLLVEADAAVVRRRLAARAPEAPSDDLIAALAARERARAMDTAEVLQVPIYLLDGNGSVEQEGQSVVDSLRRLVGGAS